MFTTVGYKIEIMMLELRLGRTILVTDYWFLIGNFIAALVCITVTYFFKHIYFNKDNWLIFNVIFLFCILLISMSILLQIRLEGRIFKLSYPVR